MDGWITLILFFLPASGCRVTVPPLAPSQPVSFWIISYSAFKAIFLDLSGTSLMNGLSWLCSMHLCQPRPSRLPRYHNQFRIFDQAPQVSVVDATGEEALVSEPSVCSSNPPHCEDLKGLSRNALTSTGPLLNSQKCLASPSGARREL